LLLAGSMPAVSSFSRTSGSASTFLIDPCSLVTTSRGVPAGATMLCQMPRSYPGKVSAMVGMSGASDRRCALTRPRILTFLSRQSGSATLMLSMPSATSPARIPVIWVGPAAMGNNGKMGPRHHVEEPDIDLRRRRADSDLEGPGLHLLLLDQFLDRVDGDVDVSDHRRGDERDQRDRHEILER